MRDAAAPATCCSSPARATRPARSSATGRLPFSDHDEVARGARGGAPHERAALDRRRAASRPPAARRSARCRAASAASRSTRRTLEPGDLFFAIKGERRDGHDFVARRAEAGRRRGGRRRGRAAELAAPAPLIVVDGRRSKALARLGRAARARSRRAHRRGHRLGRQDQHQGGAARRAWRAPGATHASPQSFNNHWGVPLTLARMPRDARFGVFEIGMNHAGEIAPLAAHGAPARRRGHHGRAGASRVLRRRSRPSPTPRPRSSRARAGRHGGAQPRQPALRAPAAAMRAASRGRARSSASASTRGADVRAERIVLKPEHVGRRGAHARRAASTYRLGAPGRHVAHEHASPCWPPSRRSAPTSRAAALALADVRAAGRARRARSLLARRAATSTLIDESYNANPASMRAALAILGAHRAPGRAAAASPCSATCWSWAPRRRRCIAGLADAGRRGRRRPRLRRRAADAGALATRLPPAQRGGYAPSAAELDGRASLAAAARRRRGDGQGLDRQPHGADRRGAEGALRRRRAAERRRIEPMLYWLAELQRPVQRRSTSSATSPSAPAARSSTALLFVFLFGPRDHRAAARSSRARASRSATTGRNRTS